MTFRTPGAATRPRGSAELVLSPTQGSLYLAERFVSVLDSDGGVVERAGEGCDDCALCSLGADCFSSPGTTEVQAGARVNVAERFDGRLAIDAGACSATGRCCRVRTPLPPGVNRARFCVSRAPTLAPLECVERPFRIPFDGLGVGACFE